MKTKKQLRGPPPQLHCALSHRPASQTGEGEWRRALIINNRPSRLAVLQCCASKATTRWSRDCFTCRLLVTSRHMLGIGSCSLRVRAPSVCFSSCCFVFCGNKEPHEPSSSFKCMVFIVLIRFSFYQHFLNIVLCTVF